MKTGGPVEFAFREKLVPFDAVTRAVKAAEERLPALADIAPRVRFGERRGRTTRISSWSGGFQKWNYFIRRRVFFPMRQFS